MPRQPRSVPACALSAAAPQPLAPATSLQLREQIRRLHRDVRACGAATAKDAPRLGRGSGTPAFAAFCSLRDPVCTPHLPSGGAILAGAPGRVPSRVASSMGEPKASKKSEKKHKKHKSKKVPHPP